MECVNKKDRLGKPTPIVAYVFFQTVKQFLQVAGCRRYVVTAASGSLNAQHSSRRNHLAQDFLRPDIDCLRRSSWMWFPMTGTAPLKDEEKQRLLALNDRGHVDADGATGTGPLTKCQRLKHPAMPTAMPLCWNITDTTESGTGLRFCTGR